MKIHELKTIPPYYQAVEEGLKNWDLRKDDRDFKVGEFVRLKEYDPVKKVYSGHYLIFRISYILRNAPKFGLKEGYCILTLE